MNDGGALLTKEQMHAKLRELAQTSPIAASGLELARMTDATGEEMALMIAISALEALRETQAEFLRLRTIMPPTVLLREQFMRGAKPPKG